MSSNSASVQGSSGAEYLNLPEYTICTDMVGSAGHHLANNLKALMPVIFCYAHKFLVRQTKTGGIQTWTSDQLASWCIVSRARPVETTPLVGRAGQVRPGRQIGASWYIVSRARPAEMPTHQWLGRAGSR
jgi:hypothetical protein